MGKKKEPHRLFGRCRGCNRVLNKYFTEHFKKCLDIDEPLKEHAQMRDRGYLFTRHQSLSETVLEAILASNGGGEEARKCLLDLVSFLGIKIVKGLPYVYPKQAPDVSTQLSICPPYIAVVYGNSHALPTRIHDSCFSCF